MNSEEVKEFIVKKREDNYTFADIAYELNEICKNKEYSRQSVHALYKRYMKKLELRDSISPEIYDAINFYCRTGNVRGTELNMKMIGCPMSASKINGIIDKYTDLALSIDEELVELVYEAIKFGDTPKELKNRLRYKNCDISIKVYEKLIYKVYSRKINEDIEKRIVESVYYNEGKKVAKQLLEDSKLEDSLTVILNRNNGIEEV